jgi:DNA repair protein RadD
VQSAFERFRSVLLVSPTGSGKTIMGTALLGAHWRSGSRVLVVAHRRELILQTAAKLRQSSIGAANVGVIMPGQPDTPSRAIQVGSIQTMLSQGFPHNIGLLVLDEAHHYPADEWGKVYERYPDAKVLGLTATPVRRDGRALGDMFEHLEVAASYSELIAEGFLVSCRVFQPERGLNSNEVAQDPLIAYQSLASGARAFGFASRVEQCEDLVHKFCSAGIPAAIIEANTPKAERDGILAAFRAGKISVLWNVYALTEGIDVPEASCVILARRFDHVGNYLQACGRVLRPALGKNEAIVIDLTGCTLLPEIGFPTEDREYSLDGKAIRRTSPIQLRVCPKCGATAEAWTGCCPECGFVPPRSEVPKLRIYDQKLREVFAGAETPAEAKQTEYSRLRNEGRKRGWTLWFVQHEYQKLFGTKPVISDASEDEMRTEFQRLDTRRTEAGYKAGWTAHQFKAIFGRWPPKGYSETESNEVRV